MALPYKPVVKNGKFYHMYGDGSKASDWRYIRPAGQAAAPGPAASTAVAGTGAQVAAAPIAPPPPYLTDEDKATQALEYAEWDRYFSGVEAQVKQQEIDTGTALAASQEAHGKNLENNDWNAAARGLGVSSIKQQDRAQIVSAFERNRSNLTDKLSAAKGHVTNERANYETNLKPLIARKWDERARNNAIAASNAAAAAQAAASGAAAPAAAAPRTTQASGGYRNVVKGGKFYHVYGSGSNERWVYIRPAS